MNSPLYNQITHWGTDANGHPTYLFVVTPKPVGPVPFSDAEDLNREEIGQEIGGG